MADATAGPPDGRAGGHASGVLHGRQQGRRLRAAQQRLLDELLPRLAVPQDGPIAPAVLFGRAAPALRVEIGFGGGEHLLGQALAHPEADFIGCEPFRNGVASLLHNLERAGAGNIRLHAGDAGVMLDRLPAGAVSRVDLLFPDPWPKWRQRKRRFVSALNLGRIARVLRPGGTFRFATDIDDYAGWTLRRVLGSDSFAWQAGVADDWRQPPDDWVPTRYEAKARREGRQPVYLTMRRR